jgi:uncharacterized coiled-coil protein SlyX
MADFFAGMASRVIRPLWRRMWSRIEARLQPLEARVAASEERVRSLEARVDQLSAAWDQLTPQFLDAISRVGVLRHEVQQLSFDQQDMAAELRRELEAHVARSRPE